MTSSPSETLDVDNDPVSVSLATPNDPNPSVWVNHAVTLDATAHAGPSGVGSLACSVDGAAAQAYPSGGVTINGTGVHTASCTATNQAVDPQGVPNSGSGSMSIKIDETPPNVLIEPSDPSNPTELVADTSDGQSGVAGGSFAMRPVGSNVWEPLSTQFDGGELIGSFDDSGLAGPYQFEATSCDNVGNCASAHRAADAARPATGLLSGQFSDDRRSTQSAEGYETGPGGLPLQVGAAPREDRPRESRRTHQDSDGHQVRRTMHSQACKDRQTPSGDSQDMQKK